MSNKIENLLSIESIREVNHLIDRGETSKNDITFNNSQVFSLDEKLFNKQSTIYTAIENFIEVERYMAFGKYEKAIICLVRFHTIIQRIIENGFIETEHYRKHRDIYDYYMSDEVKKQSLIKLELLTKLIDNKISIKENKHLRTIGIKKCLSIPNVMTLAKQELSEKTPKKFANIFDVNYLFKNKNYMFESDLYKKLINESINNRKPELRKSLSMDMKRNEDKIDAMLERVEKSSQHFKDNLCVSDRIKSFTIGYNTIVVPLIAKQTLRKIEEYKQRVELKVKSDNLVEYEWQKNRKRYIIKALKL